jgi:hypothetical protein
MEPKFNTSFIPKKSLQADVTGSSAGGKYVGRRTIHGPGYFFSMLLFLVSAVASLGLFGYTKIVESAIAEKITRLEEQKASFDPESIDLLERTDIHITNANKLLMQHVAVSELFTLLEKLTLKRVQYTELKYAGSPGESAMVTIDGSTQTFQNVALQTEQYRGDVNLTNPIVRELERLETGAVHFSVDLTVDQRLVLFSSFLKKASSNSTSEVITVPTETVTEVNTTLENVDQGTSTDTDSVTKGDS